MSNLNRVLTLRVTIKDPEAAKALWDSHGRNQLVAGCIVSALGDGDLFDERDLLRQFVHYVDYEVSRGNPVMPFEEWKESEND